MVEALAASGILVSIDSRKAAVMRAALAAGAPHDQRRHRACAHDPDSLEVAGASDCLVVLMHSQGEPATMQRQPSLRRRPARCVRPSRAAHPGLGRGRLRPRERLLLDPGIGFGKTVAHNVEILSRLGLYLGLGTPILLGVSRKSFIARLAGEAPAAERLPGSLAAALAGIAQGVAALRVHDVAATRQCLQIWQALMC